MSTPTTGGAFDPCREARYTAQLAREDAAAGHKDGEQYWKGQSEAYGFMCSVGSNTTKESAMGEEKCDPGDILCCEENLKKMKNLRGAFNDPKFRESHPALVALAPQLDQAIKEEETKLNEKLGVCNLPMPPLPEESGVGK